MNNGSNQNPDKKPFKVHIEDDGFLNPDELNRIKPSSQPKKKFEVHIEDDNLPLEYDDHTPQYKGEVYFSNGKRQRGTQNQNVPTVKKAANPSPDKRPVKKQLNSFFVVLCAAIVIFTTAFSIVAISCINDVFAFNRSEEKVKVTIPLNATTDGIIDILSDEGLIKQKLFCKFYYKFSSIFTQPDDTPEYISGVHTVKKNLGLEGYLNEFKETQRTAETTTLVFPEGWTIYQIFNKIDEFGVCSMDELLAAIQGAEFEYAFAAEIPDNANRTFKYEGYLYPDTYEFYEKSDANSIIRKFLEGTEKKWTDEYEAQRIKLGLTRDEVLIIASIIQREAANKSQMGLVSSVLHNRLNNSVSWPLLGCDSTANYISNYVAPNVSPSDALTLENSYDTYTQPGLPPGPICNPGDDAINAALFPDDTDYYYFRHDKYGKIYMARTQSEHDANGREVLRANSR